MNSREDVIKSVKYNQPPFRKLPDISFNHGAEKVVEKFVDTLTTIGGRVMQIDTLDDIRNYSVINLSHGRRNITTIPLLGDTLELVGKDYAQPHSLQNVDTAIIQAHFGVAENGAVWVTEDLLMIRVLPFICQHLGVLLSVNDLVPTMHEAYDRIGDTDYGFGAFIAGPSKTADIEQSLVLGAHGPRSFTVFLVS